MADGDKPKIMPASYQFWLIVQVFVTVVPIVPLIVSVPDLLPGVCEETVTVTDPAPLEDAGEVVIQA
jgi:hypothetical protein